MVEFESWYGEHHGRLVAAITSAYGDADMAREVADEAIVKAYERWDRVGAMTSPGGWTYRVALNGARRKHRRRLLEDRFRRSQPPTPMVGAPAGEVWLVVAALSERQRVAVALRHVAQLKEAEIAEAMGITRGGVSSTLRAAYANLRTALDEPNAADAGSFTQSEGKTDATRNHH